MEKMDEYRHIIEPEVKALFLDSLRKAIKKVDKNKFGFIGIIGSIKEKKSHDIDLLIFPNKGVKIGDAILELTKLYKETEKELKKHHERYYLSTTPKKATQELIYYLSSLEEGGAGLIPIHSLFFTNYRDLKKITPKNFENEIKKTMIVLHGKFDILKELQELPQEKIEPYFWLIDFEMATRIKNFPKHLIRTSAESLFSYLKKKYNIKINDKIPHSVTGIEKKFIKLIKILDKKTYS